jgi:dTMP kinase
MGNADARKGRLIAICGIDGSGKATQTELLAARARETGRQVQCISFPRYGQSFFADLIERYLRGEFAARAADVDPCLAALPYALDRWQAAPTIRTWLAGGCLVVCNRYVPANMAHQGSKIRQEPARRQFFAWVVELEYGVLKLPPPHLHVLLDAPPALAMELTRSRRTAAGRADAQDIHENDLDYLEATAEAYRQIAGDAPDAWAVVPCARAGAMLPREEIADGVWEAVRDLL